MLDTMTATKAVGALCGALLIFLFGQWAAEALYHVGHGAYDSHEGVAELAYAAQASVDPAGVAGEEVDFAELIATADAARGEKVFAKCKACHTIGEQKNGVGPHLLGIFGRQVANVPEFAYSGPMADLGDEGAAWDLDSLSEFLMNPRKYMPGTKMSFAGLKKPKDRANVILYLQQAE